MRKKKRKYIYTFNLVIQAFDFSFIFYYAKMRKKTIEEKDLQKENRNHKILQNLEIFA